MEYYFAIEGIIRWCYNEIKMNAGCGKWNEFFKDAKFKYIVYFEFVV